ncbi:MAG: hypothetical protein IH995_02160 [Proteobacteria bacterium]|nr:hypothetical protein [Pseudomonadota bacterium]
MTGAPKKKSAASLLTPAQIREWREELERVSDEESSIKEQHASEMRAIKAKRARLEKLIMAGENFLDIERWADHKEIEGKETFPSPDFKERKAVQEQDKKVYPRRSKSETWTNTILRIVEEAGRKMSYSEVKDEVRKTHLGDTLSRTEAAFYGALKKLEDREKLVRHRGWIFTPGIYEQFKRDVAEGKAVDVPSGTFKNQESHNWLAVERFLKNRPNGAMASEIVNHLINDPPPDLNVTKNKNSIYNLLARQRKNGHLDWRDDRYYLPRKKDEAPDSDEPDASDNHSSSGNGTLLSSGEKEPQSLFALPSAISAHPGE